MSEENKPEEGECCDQCLCAEKKAKASLKYEVDRQRPFKQIGNAWRWYETDSEKVYRSDLFSQFPKETISVSADSEKKAIKVIADMLTVTGQGDSCLVASAVIELDYAADLPAIRAIYDNEFKELVIVVPKAVITIPVE
jgi:hypothetical protein